MVEPLLLVGVIILLALANAGLSFLPRKAKSGNVSVTFIPPSAIPSESSSDGKLDAHISSSNQKIALLFARLEKLEHDVQSLLQNAHAANSPAPVDATWIETVPARKRRK